MLTANEARTITREALQIETAEFLLLDCLDTIRHAAKNRKFYVNVFQGLKPESFCHKHLVKRLKELGYKIAHISPIDKSAEEYMQISWDGID